MKISVSDKMISEMKKFKEFTIVNVTVEDEKGELKIKDYLVKGYVLSHSDKAIYRNESNEMDWIILIDDFQSYQEDNVVNVEVIE